MCARYAEYRTLRNAKIGVCESKLHNEPRKSCVLYIGTPQRIAGMDAQFSRRVYNVQILYKVFVFIQTDGPWPRIHPGRVGRLLTEYVCAVALVCFSPIQCGVYKGDLDR